MAEITDKQYLAYSILEFLDQEVKEGDTKGDRREWLELAIHNLENAFNVTLANQEFYTSQPLDQIYQEYLGRTRNTGNQSVTGPDVNRIIDTGDIYTLPMETNDENKLTAETHKNTGNEEMTHGQFWEALESYTIAINLDGRNATYFCNRAATYLKMNNLPKALRDCQVAIQLNPGYARAFGRMGVTYSAMTDHARAYACYRKAADLEPGNDTYTNNVQVTQEILALERANTGTGAGHAGNTNPGFEPFAGIDPRMFDNAQAFFNNPDIMNMAAQLFSHPGVQNMVNRLQQLSTEWGRVADGFLPNFGNNSNEEPPQGYGDNS